MTRKMLWRRSPGYVLEQSLMVATPLYPEHPLELGLIALYPTGVLIVTAGYEWDGPSGPTVDTDSTMVASCVHDALYSLMAAKLLPMSARSTADLMLRELMLSHGAGWLRAWYFWAAVRLFGRLYIGRKDG